MLNKNVIDAHVHLDAYKKAERQIIIDEMEKFDVDHMISVSSNLASAIINLSLTRKNSRVKAAFGFHPEQPLPKGQELEALFLFIERFHDEMVAVGEIGLPYFRMQENKNMDLDPYIEMLEEFIIIAKRYNKPIVLHVIREHTPIVCSLLEKHSIEKAHFHWFKGNEKEIEYLLENNYFISITPDVLYDAETKKLVKEYPLTRMMVETDGPWQYKESFQHTKTHPKLIHQSISEISSIKGITVENVYEQLYQNTINFYGL
ncbi:TatD family hydrolase [Oceanobacillus senegalensis]|uniref:TatD family hydrolase n=1 Tax=Oceanobacillus senegalensis TaxID=1936063 RepID=UPI001FEAF3CE|nr:TatD family hydrolase [Oceanobacillus senegalensis]